MDHFGDNHSRAIKCNGTVSHTQNNQEKTNTNTKLLKKTNELDVGKTYKESRHHLTFDIKRKRFEFKLTYKPSLTIYSATPYSEMQTN